MRQGFRVIDSDTHVNPSMDVLLRYADTPLRDRMDDLAPYLRKVKVAPGRGDAEDEGQATILSIKQLRYSRVAGAKPSAPTGAEGDRGFLSARTHMVTRKPITPRVADDNARGRLADMDTEGRDIDFIIPGPWAYGAPALAPHLTRGLVDAYHRYMAEYCAADPRRLKSMVLAPATDPAASARAIEQLAKDDWVAAVWPLLPEGLPVDDPDLEPIWAAANEADLPIMYHGFTIECGHGWLPHWLVRLTRQIDYVRGSVSPTLRHTPVEYAQMGRVFCGIDFSEGVELTRAVIDLLGDHVLMFESDYPHPETIFPDHADSVIAWRQSLGERATQKLMRENAARFFRLTSTPWEAP